MATQKELEARIDELNAEIDRINKLRNAEIHEITKTKEGLSKEYSQFVPEYVFMPQTSTYALGVHALQEEVKTGKYPQHPLFTLDDGSEIARPLTFRENMEAMVNDYNTLKDENGRNRTQEERLKLFTESWKDSCTGADFKAKSTKFKIIPVCRELITIPKDFSKNSLPISYDSMQGNELDSSKGKYNQLLSQKDVLEHEAWLTAVENNKALLKEYSDIVYSQLKQNAMGFWVRQNSDNDELRAVVVHDLGDYSNADGDWDLDDVGRFLLVAREKNSTGDKK